MKLKHHLEMGNKVIGDNIVNTFNINKIAYLFGNIAPDLNCVYPAHRLKTTEDRFYRRLRRVEESTTILMKSFTLGVITHYICDYFCYAHNIESIGILHKKYEKNLYNYYKLHIGEISDEYDKMLNHWVNYKRKSEIKYIKNDCMTTENNCKFILNQIKCMNMLYMNDDNLYNKDSWTTKIEQMKKDVDYSAFMIEHVLTIIIDPFKCIIDDY